jgi:hypothetical protein
MLQESNRSFHLANSLGRYILPEEVKVAAQGKPQIGNL